MTIIDGISRESEIFAYGEEMAFELAAVRSSNANLQPAMGAPASGG